MKVLGLSFVRNAEATLPEALDAMASYCDALFVVDDRSTDATPEILRTHRAVANVFTIDPRLSPEPWHLSEGRMLDLLYRMADLSQPDWIVLISADERLESAERVRATLAGIDPGVSGLQMHLTSKWDDPVYPFMVPVMSQARSMVGRVWRYQPELIAGGKRLHNSYFPANIADFGRVEFCEQLSIAHHGWSTLAERIAKVELYSSLDPDLALNDGVPYDIGLLFGYRRHQIAELLADYERRVARIRAGVRGDDEPGSGDIPL